VAARPDGDSFPAWGCGFGEVMVLFQLGSSISFFEF
jgi:hypothetical protein